MHAKCDMAWTELFLACKSIGYSPPYIYIKHVDVAWVDFKVLLKEVNSLYRIMVQKKLMVFQMAVGRVNDIAQYLAES